MDWTAASVIVSAIGIIVTIVIASRSANKELRHNRFLQERDIAIRLLHENEFDPEWLAAKRAITADTALRLARYFAQIKKQITLAFNRLQPYIEEARRITDDQNVYCNLETVAKNWMGEKDVAMKLKF